MIRIARPHFLTIDSVRTHVWIAGDPGNPAAVLLHGGEFGASAELSYERNIDALSEHFYVIAPDMLGYGLTDKIFEFGLDNRHYRRVRHLARLLETLGIREAHFVGNSISGAILVQDLLSRRPLLSMLSLTSINGAAPDNDEARAILTGFDGTLGSMKAIVELLLHNKMWQSPAYVERRLRSALVPGAYEAAAAARLRLPTFTPPPAKPANMASFSRIAIPTLFITGAHDRSCPDWPRLAASATPGSRFEVFPESAHCGQLEEAERFNRSFTEFVQAI